MWYISSIDVHAFTAPASLSDVSVLEVVKTVVNSSNKTFKFPNDPRIILQSWAMESFTVMIRQVCRNFCQLQGCYCMLHPFGHCQEGHQHVYYPCKQRFCFCHAQAGGNSFSFTKLARIPTLFLYPPLRNGRWWYSHNHCCRYYSHLCCTLQLTFIILKALLFLFWWSCWLPLQCVLPH